MLDQSIIDARERERLRALDRQRTLLDRSPLIFDTLKTLLDASRKAFLTPSPDALAALIITQENAQDEIERVEEA